jgi:hypothetical protein
MGGLEVGGKEILEIGCTCETDSTDGPIDADLAADEEVKVAFTCLMTGVGIVDFGLRPRFPFGGTITGSFIGGGFMENGKSFTNFGT